MSSPKDGAAEIISRLRKALKGYGYETDTTDGRMELHIHSGVSLAALSSMFVDQQLHNFALANLCQMMGMAVEDLLKDDSIPTDVLTVFPYHGGPPIRVLSPTALGLPALPGALFFLEVECDGRLRLAIGTRLHGAIEQGRTYVVEDDDFMEVMRCAHSADGRHAMESVQSQRKLQLGSKGKLALVPEPGAAVLPEPQITGHVLYWIDVSPA